MHYPDGVQAYLFRDQKGNCLQIIWLDDNRKDVLVPLAPGQKLELVHLDGWRTRLQGTTAGISLTASEEPLLLLYRDSRNGLAENLGTPAVWLDKAPPDISPGATSSFLLKGKGLTARSVQVDCSPLWKAVLKQAGKDRVECTIQAPASTSARQTRIHVQLLSGSNVTGQLTVPLKINRP